MNTITKITGKEMEDVLSYEKLGYSRIEATKLVLKTRELLKYKLDESLMIGDRASDLEVGFYRGVKNLFLIESQFSSVKISEELEKLKLLSNKEKAFTYSVIQDYAKIKI